MTTQYVLGDKDMCMLTFARKTNYISQGHEQVVISRNTFQTLIKYRVSDRKLLGHEWQGQGNLCHDVWICSQRLVSSMFARQTSPGNFMRASRHTRNTQRVHPP
jgi:hypothetical protein